MPLDTSPRRRLPLLGGGTLAPMPRAKQERRSHSEASPGNSEATRDQLAAATLRLARSLFALQLHVHCLVYRGAIVAGSAWHFDDDTEVFGSPCFVCLGLLLTRSLAGRRNQVHSGQYDGAAWSRAFSAFEIRCVGDVRQHDVIAAPAQRTVQFVACGDRMHRVAGLAQRRLEVWVGQRL